MKKAERNVRARMKTMAGCKLLRVKPYLYVRARFNMHNDPVSYTMFHICRGARWAMAGMYRRLAYEGEVVDGKCQQCGRKIKNVDKYELVVKMLENKEALSGSLSLVARTGDFQSSGGGSIPPGSTNVTSS